MEIMESRNPKASLTLLKSLTLLTLLTAAYPIGAEPLSGQTLFRRCIGLLSKPTQQSTVLEAQPKERTRRTDLPILVQNWALDATGMNSMREDPRLNNPNYKQNQLAIIDTGLLLRDNPYAGEQLLASSPEREYDSDGHGTAVVGTAASEKFGVNPRLFIKAIASRFYKTDGDMDESIRNQMDGKSGFDAEDLKANIAKAASDPNVKIINTSLSTLEIPGILNLYKEAMAAGKWVVVPPANSNGKINDVGNSGIFQLQSYPEFFVVGALSYCGAPSSFAHAGPETQYYAPGASIETLSSKYNPNWEGEDVTPATRAIDGGSFASPHVAAVFATVRTLIPSIDAKILRKVLDRTSIKRGKAFKISQVNDYAVIWLTLAANDLLSTGKCSSLSQCFELSFKLASQEVERIKTKNITGDRWELLKKGYFLSMGDPFFSKAILELIPPSERTKKAEALYFNTPEGIETLLADFRADTTHVKQNIVTAIKFLSGATPFITSPQQTSQIGDPREYLKKLPATEENVDTFINLTRTILRGGEDFIGASQFLRDAPRAFIFSLCRNQVNNDRFAWTDLVLAAEGRAESSEEKKLVRMLLEKSALNWTYTKNFRSLEFLKARIENLSPLIRKSLLDQYRDALPTEEFRYVNERTEAEKIHAMELDLISWIGGEDLERKRADVERYLKTEHRLESEGKLHLDYLQWRAGNRTRDQLHASFSKALQDVAANPSSRYGNDMIPYVAVNAAARDADMALRLSQDFSQPGMLASMYPRLGGQRGSQVVAELINRVPDDVGSELLFETAHAWGDQDDGAKWVLDAWFLSRDKPASKAFAERLLKNPQNDPALQAVRVGLLEFQAKNATTFNSYVQSYLNEAPAPLEGGDNNLLNLSSKIVAGQQQLMNKFKKQLDEAKTCQRDCRRYLQWAVRAHTKEDFREIMKAILPRLADILRNVQYYEGYDLRKFAEALGSLEGQNHEMIALALSQIKTLSLDSRYMDAHIRPDGKSPDSGHRDEGIIAAVQVLGLSRQGSKILSADPEWNEYLASYIVTHAKRHLFENNIPIPKSLAAATRKLFPSASSLAQMERSPNWMPVLFKLDPASLSQLLNYLSDQRIQRNKNIVTSLAYYLADRYGRFTSERPEIKAFLDKNQGPAIQEIRKIVEEKN